MTGLASILKRAAALMERHDVPWAMVGGWAVSARTEPRFTRDVDLAVAVADDAVAQRMTLDFRAAGYVVAAVVEQDATSRLATVRLKPPQEAPGVLLDLLFASSGIEREVCDQAEPLEILPGMYAPIARPEHLLALKILFRDDRTRPQDAVDIRALVMIMDDAMQDNVLRALDLITERGYHRDRDLRRLFHKAVAEFCV